MDETTNAPAGNPLAALVADLREQEALQNFHIAIATIEGLAGNPFTLTRESSR